MLKNLLKKQPDKVAYPDYLKVYRRRVKRARLQLDFDGEVQMVVPYQFRDGDIEQFYRHNQNWIESKRQQFLLPRHQALGIAEGQLLLFGQGYDFKFSETATQAIDHERRLVTGPLDLTQRDTREIWYRSVAKPYLTRRIESLAGEHGFRFNRLFIRGQRTRWGSCSARSNISLNWKLIMAPEYVSDYVILHELVHTRILNHSAAFWRRVEKVAPDYDKAKSWLKRYGPYL